jgi:hypothetical protein
VTGTFETVIAKLAFFFVANYTLSFVTLFVLRRREPDAHAAVSRVGTSVHDRPRARSRRWLPHRRGDERRAQQSLLHGVARAEPSGVSVDRRHALRRSMIDSRLEYASHAFFALLSRSRGARGREPRVFGRTWQLAGRADQVREAGQYFTATIGDEPVLVVRGATRAARDVERLPPSRRSDRKRRGKRPVLQCGYHGWTYSLDGRLARTPEFEGVEEFDRATCALPQFQVDVWNELVFVNLDPAAESLADFLGELDRRHAAARLQRLPSRAADKVWELDCNWKVYVDNYLEGYHIPIVHPGLFRELDYANYRTETKRTLLDPVRADANAGAHSDRRRRRSGPLLLDLPEPDAERLSRQLLDESHRPARPGADGDALRLVLQGSGRGRRRRSTRRSHSATRSSSRTSTSAKPCSAACARRRTTAAGSHRSARTACIIFTAV